jgi:hypothetical protein
MMIATMLTAVGLRLIHLLHEAFAITVPDSDAPQQCKEDIAYTVTCMSAFDRRLTRSEFHGRGCAIVDLRPSSEPFPTAYTRDLCCIDTPNEAQSGRAWFSLLYSKSSDKQLE